MSRRNRSNVTPAGTRLGAVPAPAFTTVEVKAVKLIAKTTILLHPDDATLLGRFVQPGESFEIADEKAAAILIRDGEAATPEAYATGESRASEVSPEASAEDANDEE